MSTNLITHLHLREQLIKQIRSYLNQRGFHEIFPTLLNKSLPLEPTLYAYETTSHQFLPTSPESSLKKYLALTGEKCYAIAPAFRNLESIGPLHKSEFLLLELYEPGQTYLNMMDLTRELIISLPHPESWNRSWPVLSLIKLFRDHLNLDLTNLVLDNVIQEEAKSRGYNPVDSTWEQLFNQIFLNEIEPFLPQEPFFLTDYPARISPLAEIKKDNPNFSERFELYLNRIELANGNTENIDTQSVGKSMKNEKKYRLEHKLPTHPIDQEFLQSLEKLSRPTAGVGLGIDRLTMLLNNEDALPPLLS